MSYTLSAPFTPNILNNCLFIPSKHFRQPPKRSIGIIHSHSETHVRIRTILEQFERKTIPPFAHAALCQGRRRMIVSRRRLDRDQPQTEECRSGRTVVTSSQSSFRIRCASLHFVPTMQVMCHQHTHKSRAFKHVSDPLAARQRHRYVRISRYRDINLGTVSEEERLD